MSKEIDITNKRFNRLIALVNSRPLHLIYKFLLPLLIVLDKIIGFFLRGIKR